MTTLNFSVLQNNTNIYNIYSAVIIIEENSGRIGEQIPYRVYESSDIILPFTFQNATDHTITLQTRITGDEKYQATPLVASFDIAIADSRSLIAFNELVLFYVTPGTLVITGIIIYQHVKRKESSDDINICYWMYYRCLIAFNHRVFPIAERLFSTLLISVYCLTQIFAMQEPVFAFGSSWRQPKSVITTKAAILCRLYKKTTVLTLLLS